MIDEELKAKVQEFCLMDDTFFNCFMKDNSEGMEYVLNIIMGRDDLRVECIETQHDVPPVVCVLMCSLWTDKASTTILKSTLR